jgi:hypothetical protein
MNTEEAIEKARDIIEEVYRKDLAEHTVRNSFAIRSTRSEDQENAARRRDNAIKAFVAYIKHVETLTLKIEKPTVIKREGAWCFEKDRLFVCPVIRFKSSMCEGRVLTHYDFKIDRDSEGTRSIPTACYRDKDDSCISSYSIPQGCHRLIFEVCGEKLDALNRQIAEIGADVKSRLDEIIAAHKSKRTKKEAAKFQEKLMKFLKAFPFFADAKSEFVMDCFQIEPDDLEGLQKFLKTNRADVNFVTIEDISEARQLAQIAEVHDG